MDRTTQHEIEMSPVFVCVLPPWNFEGSEGDRRLQYAIALGKHVMVLRLPGRENLRIPTALDYYEDYQVIDGDGGALVAAFLKHFGTLEEVQVIKSPY